jgi:hypothetical protein
MKKRISIQLTETRIDINSEREPLGEVLREALKVIHPNRSEYRSTEVTWLVAAATRAVCEAIIRDGFRSLPMSVNQTDAPYWHMQKRGPSLEVVR